MSTRLEHDKCWIKDPESLRVKRFLSDTRTYFKDGVWIRDQFLPFFPEIRVTENGELYYDLGTLDPKCSCLSGGPISNTKISQDLINQFAHAIQSYLDSINGRNLSFNAEVSSREFTLPDPSLHPEVYQVLETDEGFRLIVLWGLASDLSGGNVSVEDLPNLLRPFVGKRLKAKKTVHPAPSAPQKPIVEEPKKKKNEVAAPVNKNPEPAKATAEIPAESVESKVSSPEEISHSKPAKKVKPVEKVKPPKKKKPAKKVSTPRKQVEPKKLSPATKLLFKRVSIAFLSILLLIWIVTELAFIFLGPDVKVSPQLAKSDIAKGLSIRLEKGQALRFYDGSVMEASDNGAIYSLKHFPKAGNYEVSVIDLSTKEILQKESLRYDNARNGMSKNPIASLFIDQSVVAPGTTITAYCSNSFHQADEKMVYQISWGEGDSRFEKIEDPTQALTHVYSDPGEYKITLMVKDSKDQWDYDVLHLKVTTEPSPEPVNTAFHPVADVSVQSIEETQGDLEVILDLSGSYDPDGKIDGFEIIWGDGTDTQIIHERSNSATHLYNKKAKRVTILVWAIDNEGLQSSKPARLDLDFQSAQMNDRQRFAKNSKIPGFSKTLYGDDPNNIRLLETRFEKLHKNKKRISFELINPESAPVSPLFNINWNLFSGNNLIASEQNADSMEINVVDGVYILNVTAEGPGGQTYRFRQRITSYEKQHMSPLSKSAHWLTHNFPYLSFSHYL